MSTYTYTGTSGVDDISTYDLNKQNPGFEGFEIYGLDGDDTISLSIMSRSGVDIAWGGNGNDFMTGGAFFSNYAAVLFGGGYGNDRVYFPLMDPELNAEGKPNFIRSSETTTNLTLTASDGSILFATIADDVETIYFRFGEYYLTEDIAHGRIRAVGWQEAWERTYYENADWYLKNLDTYAEYHGLNTFIFRSDEISSFSGTAEPGDDYELYFDVEADEHIYTYFNLTGFSDDLDLYLYKQNSSGEYGLVNYSEGPGSTDESLFKALSAGSYKVSVSLFEDLDFRSNSSFSLSIDSKSFLAQSVLPNDPLFDDQWSLFNTGQADGADNEDILAPEAWKLQNKSPDIVVAVIDSGIRTSHDDLVNNIWRNPGEIPKNGIDDDNNGYVDDVNGWNFERDLSWWIAQGHGTHVAGIIAAEGNNSRGIAGVTWDAQLMCLDVFNSNGTAFHEDIIDAIYYAANNGADVINLSLGQTVFNSDISSFAREFPGIYEPYLKALRYATENGCVVVCAAGNDDLNTQRHFQIPASFSSLIPGVISVAAVGNLGQITQYSNYSDLVTIAAPGGDHRAGLGSGMISTSHLSDSSYVYKSGTSMAAPLVSGAAALILQKNKGLSPSQVEEILTTSAIKHKSLDGFVQDGNYLDLEAALQLASEKITNSIQVIAGNIYRLSNPITGRFLFSSNKVEIDIITGMDWINEGIAYKSPGSDQETTALHRFNTNGNGHFYTANEYEKEILESTTSWSYEGIAFQVYSHEQASSVTGAVPVIRYLNTNSGVHLYSTSSFEQDLLNEAPEWLSEGIAWYGEAAI